MKKLIALILTIGMCSGCASATAQTADKQTTTPTTTYPDETIIVLDDAQITANGTTVTEDTSKPIYVANDIVYYEDLDTYEDTGYTYGAGSESDQHTQEEADAHTVLHITQAGVYRLTGTLSLGQINIDLGEEAESDPSAVVTLVLDNVEITSTVAPAVIFYNVYECDSNELVDDDTERAAAASMTVDTTSAGAKVIIADGSTNNINGSYVAKIYKNDGSDGTSSEKKLWKQDGAFYSYMSMTIEGESEETGVLNITAANEGLDSEHHLTINSGRVYISSQNDGINTNDDGVSVTTINGGTLHIVSGLGQEGDGIDSNGWLVINGGTVIAAANPASDSGLDADMGAYINGGIVVSLGSTMDWAESDSTQVTMNLQFATSQNADEAIVITKEDGTVVFAFDLDKDEIAGANARKYQGAVISCPEFEVGETYYLYNGGEVEGTESLGIYDASTVTGFTNATQQMYTGTDVGMGRGGMGGGFKGENGEFTGEKPEDFDGTLPSDRPEGGNFNGQRPNMENGTMPSDMPENMPQENNTTDSTEASNAFTLSDAVNRFSGITDYDESVVNAVSE